MNSANTEEAVRSALQAGFNAGWAAAMLRVAGAYEKAGNAATAAYLRQWANQPDPVELVKMPSRPGGDA